MEFLFDPEIDLELFVEEDWESCWNEASAAKQPSVKKSGHKSPPKGYPMEKHMYADPMNYKYPLDTEDHVRAALSYFSKPKNRSEYSSEEQEFMWARMLRAAKKYGIKVKKAKSEIETEEVSEQMDEKIQELKKLLADVQGLLATVNKAEGATEQKDELVKLSEALKASLATLEAGMKEIVAKLEPAKPLVSEEELTQLRQRAEAGDVAVKELETVKAEATLKTRLSELASEGLQFEGEAGTAQATRVKAMSDEQFGSYKSDLLLAKASVKPAVAQTDEEKKAAEAEQARLLALASKEVTNENSNPYLGLK